MPRMGGMLFSLALAFACHGAQEPLFEGLGSYMRTITTSSPEAQRYFNQGLAFLHGFNHGAAIRSFQQAAELDPECAMAHWAIALASGPHINYPLVPPPAAERAWRNSASRSNMLRMPRRSNANSSRRSATGKPAARRPQPPRSCVRGRDAQAVARASG
jgi:hypothetical protein